MTIEIHQPELEALIQKRMASGRFATIEDALLEALQPNRPEVAQDEGAPKPPKKSFTQFMMESPLWGSEIEFERNKDVPRIIEF